MTKTKTPAKPKRKQNLAIFYKKIDGVAYMLVPEGTYVSKGKLSEWVSYSKGLEKLIEDKDGNLTILSSKIYDMRKEKEAAAQNFKESQKEHNRCNELIVSLSEENKALKEQYKNLESSFSQLAEENKTLKEMIETRDGHINEMDREFINCAHRESECLAQRDEEARIAKFNFKWAMIATAAFILSIIYILIH